MTGEESTSHFSFIVIQGGSICVLSGQKREEEEWITLLTKPIIPVPNNHDLFYIIISYPLLFSGNTTGSTMPSCPLFVVTQGVMRLQTVVVVVVEVMMLVVGVVGIFVTAGRHGSEEDWDGYNRDRDIYV